ncbi:hypothetical protein NPIL_99291 [Nephila pilipes]|uniref:Uncharacterized protein n=1 Tax=Nephila pilipes TaxID=299642 RepID=A0A8X6UQF7_NEPPI|nr:hypothetical protein NPIL_99291 [Nephila pilipes]
MKYVAIKSLVINCWYVVNIKSTIPFEDRLLVGNTCGPSLAMWPLIASKPSPAQNTHPYPSTHPPLKPPLLAPALHHFLYCWPLPLATPAWPMLFSHLKAPFDSLSLSPCLAL